MKTYKKRFYYGLLSAFIGISSLLLTGCWSGNEVDTLSIINVLGVDVNKAGNFEVTMRVVKPQELYINSANSGGSQVFYQPVIETGEGKSIVQAMTALSERVSNRIYLGHVEVVIIGQKAARDRIQDTLDFLERENHFRPNIKLLVTKGSAQSVLQVKPRLETTLGAEISSFIENTKYHPTSMVTDVIHFMQAQTSKTSDPYTGVISLEDSGNQNMKQTSAKNAKRNKGQEVDKENDHKKLVFMGTAVFKKNGLIGFLNSQETEGFQWVRGEVKNDIIVLNCPGSDDGTISVKISETQSRIKPKVVNGSPVIDDTIKVDADIRQMTCKDSRLSTHQLKNINKHLQKKVLDDVNAALKKVKNDWQADIFGFGEAFYKKQPEEWKQLESRWTQGELHNLKVNVRVNANISNYGLVKYSR